MLVGAIDLIESRCNHAARLLNKYTMSLATALTWLYVLRAKPTCFSIELSNSGINGLLIKREGILSDVIHEVKRGSESTEGLPTHRGWGPLHRELAWQASLDGPSSLWPRSQPT